MCHVVQAVQLQLCPCTAPLTRQILRVHILQNDALFLPFARFLQFFLHSINAVAGLLSDTVKPILARLHASFEQLPSLPKASPPQLRDAGGARSLSTRADETRCNKSRKSCSMQYSIAQNTIHTRDAPRLSCLHCPHPPTGRSRWQVRWPSRLRLTRKILVGAAARRSQRCTRKCSCERE